MREIKFRAWDKDKMYPPEQVAVWDGSVWITEFTYEDGGTCQDDLDFRPDAIALQYTGLKDKNGVPIYQGDIVIADWGYGSYRGIKDKKPQSKATLVDFEDIIYAKLEHIISDDIEVIGNQYENPELLGESNA